MRILLILAMLTSVVSSCNAQTPALMPLPAHLEARTGELVIDRSFSVAITGHKDARLQRTVELFLDDLRRQIGITAMPLNHLIEVARPESLPARHFSELVDALVAGNLKPGVEPQLRAVPEKWRNNHTDLQPFFEQLFLMKEVDTLSQNLSALGAAGPAALEYLDRGEPAPAAWVSQQLSAIEQIKKPQAQVLLVVAPSVHKLVQASAGQAALPAK